VHQPDISTIAGRSSIEVDALEQRTGTVPNSYDGNSDFIHLQENPRLAVAARPGQESCHHIALFVECNPGGETKQKKRSWRFWGPAQAVTAGDFD
jgi:hypothetical protein